MSQPITITVPHKLGKAEARSRVETSVGRFKEQLGQVGVGKMQHAWRHDQLGFQAQVLGQTVTGRIDVRDVDLRIEVDLPAFLGAFADKIAGKLKRGGTLLVEKK